jgi:chromosome segregation ATPase
MLGLLIAMLVVLVTMGRDLQRGELARRTASSDLALLNETNRKLRAKLQAAEEGQARLATEAKRAAEEVVALRSELERLQARVEAMETARRTAAGALQELKAAPAPDPTAHRGEVPAAQRDNPPLQYRAARRALEKRGFAGFCQAIGIDEKVQPRFRKAYEAFLARVREADKAHADVTAGEDAVVVFIDLYAEEGHALHKAWEDIFTPILTPDQKVA